MSIQPFQPATAFMRIFPFYRIHLIVAFFISFCLLQLSSDAQEKSKINIDSLFEKYRAPSAEGFNITYLYYIISTVATINKHLPVTRSIDEQHAIIQLSSRKTFDSLQALAKIAPANNNWKLSPAAEKLMASKGNALHPIILSAKDHTGFENLKTRMSGFTVKGIDNLSHSLIILCNHEDLPRVILPINEVIFIDVKSNPQEEVNIIGYDRSFHGINSVDYLIDGANGKHIVAGVKEQKMDETDIDLYKRVLPSPIQANTTSYHATVISSIIGGAGNSFYSGRGIAHACTFFPSTFENLFADDTAILRANKVSVQNHSYGTIIQQFYGAEALSYDALCASDKTLVAVFSAGNQGTGNAGEGQYANIPGFANITGNFKMAKNIITVGAIDNKGNLPAESSSGPLYDGRLAPQLIALGPNGTSDAAAIVSGTIAVMQQVYADNNQGNLPPASLIKAVLYNNAEDIYHKGIDFKTGYGLLDSYASTRSMQQKSYDSGSLVQGQEWIKTVSVPTNTAEFKVTLAWTDTVAALNNNKALVNDLDLEVREINTGNIIRPWVLNSAPNPDSLIQPAVRKRDSLNTAEPVSIALPAPGNYEIKVTGSTTGSNPVPFHIAYKTDTLHTFRFTNPLQASDVNLEENEQMVFIKWQTFVADTNETGNLFISYNNGTDWQLLISSQKLYTNHYRWLIKDTSSIALLKMETSFGEFISAPFIISKMTRLVVDYLCADSARLSWKKHINAGAYKIFTLADSPYLEHVLTVSDTFVVVKKAQFPSLIFAVEPVLNNGLPAARSIAININLQGVGCFYKTFYYNLLDKNSLDLVLELSLPAAADSIYFEKVNASGQLLEIYGTTKVLSGQSLYKLAVHSLNEGTTYMRARIKLNNGAIVYTYLINLVTSGNRYLLFYPNPVNHNGQLNYSLQLGVPSDCKLLLYDMSGRLVKNYSFLPNSIDTRGFAAGIYIYKLFDPGNALLETGKLVIQ